MRRHDAKVGLKSIILKLLLNRLRRAAQQLSFTNIVSDLLQIRLQ